MRSIQRGLAALLLLTSLAVCGGASAADPAPPAQAASAAAPGISPDPAAVPEPTVPAMRAQLDKIPQTLEDRDEDVPALIAQTDDIAVQAQRFVDSRTGPLAALNARLGELGAAPAKGTAEDADVTRQRAALEKERNALDADIRLARLVAVDAQQRAADLRAQRRARFEARLLERANSPLGTAFWRSIGTAWPADRARLYELLAEVRTGASTALRGNGSAGVIASLVGALLLAFAGSWGAEHGLTVVASRVFPVGRLRRSLLALATVAVTTALVALAAQWGWKALLDAGDWGALAERLGESVAMFAIFPGFVVGLGRALLANRRPSWRLPPIADAMAARMTPFPWLIAFVCTAIWLTTQINTLVEASLASAVATHVVTALGLSALAALMLLRLRLSAITAAPSVASPRASEGKVPASAADKPAGEPAPETVAAPDSPEAVRPLWVGLVLGAISVLLVAICVLVATGYVALASFVASQMIWSGIVGAAAYLMFKFADDLFMALVSSNSSAGQHLQKSLNVRPRLLDQAAVLLSAASRVTLFVYMILALLAPLGTSPGEVFQRSGQLGSGLKIGQFEIVPGAILGALGVAAVGFALMGVLKRWLDRSYLPTTTLEPGMRSSLTTLLGYIGGALVIGAALSALGLGIERIAWVASALSVGIGFGLQAVVQNFICGLILLAERPVKVGDWVVLGTAEGDVKRINVRATEITLGDRSTLIVPNSEFITKTVRNMTLANAEGRVLIRLPMPLTTDAARARDVMLRACAEHETVLPEPAASVTLDGIESGFLIFQVIAYVPSPRLAGGVRSDLLFTILDELRTAELPLAAYAAAPMPAPAPTGGVPAAL
ncbi:MAG: mechanosensitive ion channel family protein [Variovorax sp.]|nr:MAG: mechanosensitive ion channel family protein [Variovorax sp.]